MADSNEDDPYARLKYINVEKFLERQEKAKGEPTFKGFLWNFFPLVAGMGAATFAIINGGRHFIKNDHAKQQRMMMLRVGAQGFAIVSLLVFAIMNQDAFNKRQKEMEEGRIQESTLQIQEAQMRKKKEMEGSDSS